MTNTIAQAGGQVEEAWSQTPARPPYDRLAMSVTRCDALVSFALER